MPAWPGADTARWDAAGLIAVGVSAVPAGQRGLNFLKEKRAGRQAAESRKLQGKKVKKEKEKSGRPTWGGRDGRYIRGRSGDGLSGQQGSSERTAVRCG